MKTQLLLLCLSITCLSNHLISAKTLSQKRGDKISDHFKQLAPEEIDPNVAPPDPEKVDVIDPTEDVSSGSGGTSAAAVEEAAVEEAAEEDSAANEIVNEAANEVIEGQQAEEAAAAPQQAVTAATPKPAAVQSPTSSPGGTAEGLSKYCKCTDNNCDCCRDIGIPLLPLRSQGCAKVSYLGNEKMSVSIRYGDITLATRTISGKKAKPICVGLPGGYNSFCGRVYGLSKAKEDFKACLGFELRAEDEIEAALRVSCFKFGPEGLRVAEAEPLPSEVNKQEEDDDDFFGLGGGDDEDDDDDEGADADDEDDAEDDDDYAEAEAPEAPEDADYGGFSLGALLDELAGDDEDAPAAAAAGAAAAIKPTPSPVTTRNASVSQKVQSKDDKGSAAAAAADAVVSAEEAAAAAAAAASAVTPLPAAASEVTTTKSKKSKKAKKNKKKTTSATSEAESGFAYEFINGILDFFN